MNVTINDRIRAHRSAPDVYDPPTFEQMADHIEELEANLAKYKRVASATDNQCAASESEVAELKAKLNKVTAHLNRLAAAGDNLLAFVREENAFEIKRWQKAYFKAIRISYEELKGEK